MIKNNIIIAVVAALCVGCAAPPVKQKFPDVPQSMLTKCPQLDKLSEDAKLSSVAKTVTKNYSTYYECAVMNDAWIEWYQIQKKIFEEANQ